MRRSLPAGNLQENASRLRNELCRLGSPVAMAEVSSHLRNFAVAEATGLIGMLDGHPRIARRPAAEKGPAQFQQMRGTVENPLTHVIPCNLLLDGDTLLQFYRSPGAKEYIHRVFGMGVIAPENWAELEDFAGKPREVNVVDNIAERYRAGGGLVDAFVACAEAAVERGGWDGSGKRRHDLPSLIEFISGIYRSIWIPGARAAYGAARTHVASQIPAANAERGKKLRRRLEIVDAQIRILDRDALSLSEAAKNVVRATGGETWG